MLFILAAKSDEIVHAIALRYAIFAAWTLEFDPTAPLARQ